MENAESVARRLGKSVLKDVRASALTAELVRAYKEARMAEGRKPGTIRAELGILKTALNRFDAVPHGLKRWGMPRDETNPRTITPEGIERTFAELDPDRRVLRKVGAPMRVGPVR